MNQKVLFGFLVMVTLTLQGCGMTPETPETTTAPTVNESTQTTTGETTTGTETTDASKTEVNESESSDTSMLNGTFHLTDTYQSPGGPEELDATVTIKNNVISAVEAKNVAVLQKSKMYQDLFIEGIAGQVVGKNIKDVNVSYVNGSSLTAQSFNKALHALENNN